MSYKYTHGKKRKFRWTSLLVLSLIVAGGGGVAAIYESRHSPAPLPASVISKQAPKVAATVTTNYGLPNRLLIPKLQIDTHVIYVGLTKDGNMSVPNNVVDAGWYKYGALPGNAGTAVIAGHLDGLRGEPGVFSNLGKLAPGDAVLVTESNGLTVAFTVRETKKYPQTAQPPEVFSSPSGAHLNLITCTGSWDKSQHKFAERLVVFADKAM